MSRLRRMRNKYRMFLEDVRYTNNATMLTIYCAVNIIALAVAVWATFLGAWWVALMVAATIPLNFFTFYYEVQTDKSTKRIMEILNASNS